MDMNQEVTFLPGIGPKTAETLEKAGIFTIRDLFYYLPRTYENYQSATSLSEIRPGRVVVRAKVKETRNHPARSRRLVITEAILEDETDTIRAVWFNQAYRANQFENNKYYIFSGSYELKNGRYQLSSPQVRVAPAISDSEHDGLQPVYPMKSALKPDYFRRLITGARGEFAKIPDLLPITEGKPDFVKKNARQEALFNVHFPSSEQEAEQGRRYLAYEELFELILAAQLNRQENQKLAAQECPFVQEDIKGLLNALPFQLTNAQKRAVWDILQDLEKPTPMNRLLQGDVGSGKTIVAAIAAFQAIRSGYQVALLAPTAILATQHANALTELLAPMGIRVGLLIGATKNKTELKKMIKNGEVDLIIGTHAIITDDTKFHQLAFCIIDEQHRFGVNQRQQLLMKGIDGKAPHLLTMTATPIPRSLQLTIFGDLEVSVISELPKGRQLIKTRIMQEMEQQDVLYPHVREEVSKGRQIYWICRAIDDSPRSETTSVKRQTEKLKQLFSDLRIGFLHGHMRPAEKDQIMADFLAHELDILVSTTVVEVGVNVPNATVMVIVDAENYGLAQLHQLRGRVGRGSEASYCYLITNNDAAPSKRLRELEASTDGFHLAEVDLELRGPGEIYGSLQHGVLDLRIATLADTKLIAAAGKQAREFAKDPSLMVKYPELLRNISKYQQLTTLN